MYITEKRKQLIIRYLADVWDAKDQLESDLDALPDYLKDFINEGIIDWDELAAYFEESEDEESED